MGYYARDGAYIHDEHDQTTVIREGIPRCSGIREKSENAKYWEEVEKRQREREQAEALATQRRLQENKEMKENLERKSEVLHYLTQQKRENYKKMNFFKKAIATLSGKGYYKTDFWDLARQEVDQMSEKEIDTFYKTNVR